MAPITKTYADIYAMLKAIVYAPAGRFHSDTDLALYIPQAATLYANDIGGLHLIDKTTVTVASQGRYAINAQHKAIKRAFYVTDIDTEDEVSVPMEVITQENADFIRQLSVADTALPPPYFSFNLTGLPTALPKFLLDRCQEGYIVLKDPPETAGDTIKLYTISLPSALSPGVIYDGDERDVYAIACKVAAMCRMKSRDTQESSFFSDEYKQVVASYKMSRAKEKRISQAVDGRFLLSNLRSIDGAV